MVVIIVIIIIIIFVLNTAIFIMMITHLINVHLLECSLEDFEILDVLVL